MPYEYSIGDPFPLTETQSGDSASTGATQPTTVTGGGIYVGATTLNISGATTSNANYWSGGSGYYGTTSSNWGDPIREELTKIYHRLHKLEEDARMRAKYPVLQDAYEQYEVLKELCRSEEDVNNTDAG
jgi:hypothetical protein